MIWANFLHIYQPPTQKEFWIKKISNECYRPLVRGLLENPQAKITLNINAVLTELFVKHGGQDIIDGLRTLAERGQLEFTGSAKFHPFLPLMPESEIERQIQLNSETNQKFFGSVYQPRGFFPPEMAYNRKVADVARSMGFKWLIIDELAHSGKMQAVRWDRVYTLAKTDDFFIFFRDRDVSFRILSAEVGVSIFSAGMMLKTLGHRLKSDEFLLTAMDGETFGHHRPGLDTLLFELYQVPEIESVKMSEIPDRITKRETIEPLPSTWALMRKDLEQKLPYSRWYDESNEIHRLQWKLTNLALDTIHKLPPTDPAYPAVRASLDKAIHSDQYWWASASPWWSIEMIEAGAKDLKDTIETNPAESPDIKEQARTLYQQIIYTAFDWQRTDKISGMIKAADEDVTQRITRELPHIPLEEFETMVRNLETQMETAAKSREYERAAQLRDRAQELLSKKLDITGSS